MEGGGEKVSRQQRSCESIRVDNYHNIVHLPCAVDPLPQERAVLGS